MCNVLLVYVYVYVYVDEINDFSNINYKYRMNKALLRLENIRGKYEKFKKLELADKR